MSYQLTRTVTFGSGKAGLAAVGFTLLNADGSTNTARSTAGVVELGGGQYASPVTFPDSFRGFIKWDTGEASPLYASEEVNPQTGENSDVKVSTRSSHTPAQVRQEMDANSTKLALLDASVSSRSTYAGADTLGTTTLLSRLTAARAGYLDALNGIVASVWAAVADSPGVATLLARVSNVRAAALDNLDAQVSSRLAANAYTPPDNTDSLAAATGVAVLVGRLTTARANALDLLDASVSSRSSHSAADVWAVTQRTLTSFGSLVSDVAVAAWALSLASLTQAGSVGAFLVSTLNAIRARTDFITPGVVRVLSPVAMRGAQVSVYRATTLKIMLEQVGVLAPRDEIYFSVKAQMSDDDASARVRITENRGLVTLNAEDVSATRSSQGSLVVADDDSVTVTLDAAAAAELSEASALDYDLKVVLSSGVEERVQGKLSVLGVVTHATT